MSERFKRAFFAYPAAPADLAETISAATAALSKTESKVALTAWPQMEIFGASIPDEVRKSILESDVLVCDVTIPNLNVYYEAGFAIGSGKSIAPVINSSFESAASNIQKDGFFDNIGFKTYENRIGLVELLLNLPTTSISDLYSKPLDGSQPLFMLDTLRKTDFRNSITAAIKSTKVFYRTFDPVEVPRFSTVSIVGDATASSGIIIPLLAAHLDDAPRHNLRAAFLAGLSHGLGRPTLILQLDTGSSASPIDYRDQVTAVRNQDQVTEIITAFATGSLVAAQSLRKPPTQQKKSALQQLSLGASAAENEFRVLEDYFVETSEFLRALRGEVSVVAGRKGSGKSAIFFRVRDTLSGKKRTIVTDLKPDSHQLSLFREELLKIVNVGVFDHTLAAFWYFVILSELAITIKRRMDRSAQFDMESLGKSYAFAAELDRFDIKDSGDFTARVNKLGAFVIAEIHDAQKRRQNISPERLTNIVFRDGIVDLKKLVTDNIGKEESVYFLFDNIDKGWPANGVDQFDVRLVRLLLEALEKITRDLAGGGRDFNSIVFLRNDIYELMVNQTPDRGKSGVVSIDWTDRAKLRQVIHKRLQAATHNSGSTFQVMWLTYFSSQVRGQDSFEYVVDHCLMRPRFLINIIENAIANAINRGHLKVDEDDFTYAVRQHANYLVDDFGYEIRDASGLSSDLLYGLIGMPKVVNKDDVLSRFADAGIAETDLQQAFRLMLWYGVIGLRVGPALDRYIYDYDYNMKRLEAEVRSFGDQAIFVANDAIHVGLTH